jgi:hypothetical protein
MGPGNPEGSAVGLENPFTPCQKARSSDYRPVQDLHQVNEATETIHSVVPNPHTLLSLIPPTTRAFTCLDLKDAFFCLQLVEASQPPFTFEWEDPDTGAKGQLIWSRLPQGFKNSPTIFGDALARDLENCRPKDCTILQYVDDILLAAPTLEACKNGPEELLQFLQEAGYKVSQKKAQICPEEVICLAIT